MSELKIITHTTYTYETSDGREFDDELEAKGWQKQLSLIEGVCMFDSKFKPTKEIESVFYIHIKTKEQAEAFNSMQEYFGICASGVGVGYYYYDEISDSYVNVELQIKELHNIIDKLKGGADNGKVY